MKIAIVVDQPHWTGVGLYAMELFNLMNLHIDNIRLIYTGSVEDNFPNQEKIPYFKKTRHYINRPIIIRYNYNKLFKDNSYKDYLFHYVGTDFFGLKSRPGIMTVHDVMRDRILSIANLNPLNALGEIERIRKYYSTLIAAKTALNIISISEKTRNDLKQLTGVDSKVIYHWIVNKKFEKRDKLQVLDLLRLDKNYKYILAVGNNRPNKRLDLIKQFSDNLPKNYKLIKLGSPVISNKVINVGKVSDNMYPFYFNVSEAYLHMSDDEGFGRPLIEALGSEIPVICRKTQINYEILGNATIAVDSDEIGSKIGSILEKLEDTVLWNKQIEMIKIRKRLFQQYDIAQEYLKFYSKSWGLYDKLKRFGEASEDV